MAMSNTLQGFSQPILTNVIPGSKRKQESFTGTEVQQSVAESSSKKARLETNQHPFIYTGSPEEFDDNMSTGEEAEVVQSPSVRPHPESAEAELSKCAKAPSIILKF